jgi:hypothetical protein
MDQILEPGSALGSDMKVIDRTLAVAAAVRRHVTSEFTNDPVAVLATVSDQADLAFGITDYDDDGRSFVRAISARSGVQAHYEALRDRLDVVAWRPHVSIKRDWFVFENGISTFRDVVTGGRIERDAIVFLPADPAGIHGEIGWPIHVGARPGDPQSAESPIPTPYARAENVELLKRLATALAAQDTDAVAALLDPAATIALRDYGAGLPFRAERGPGAAHAVFGAWFERFAVDAVDLLDVVAGDWYVFAEHRWTVRQHDGRTMQFLTATMCPIVASQRFTALLGHGTDPVEV